MNAHLVFRAYSLSTPLGGLDRIVGNLVRRRPGPLGHGLLYAGLTGLYILLWASLVRALVRLGRPARSATRAPDETAGADGEAMGAGIERRSTLPAPLA